MPLLPGYLKEWVQDGNIIAQHMFLMLKLTAPDGETLVETSAITLSELEADESASVITVVDIF